MRTTKFISLLSFLIVATAFFSFRPIPSGAKKIGIYDKDSVLNNMPAHTRLNDALLMYATRLDSQLLALQWNLKNKEDAFHKDSTSLNPQMRAVKLKEIEDQKANIAAFQDVAQQDLALYKSKLEAEYLDDLKLCENTVRNKKHLDDIMARSEMKDYEIPPNAVLVNVTADMMKEAAKYQ